MNLSVTFPKREVLKCAGIYWLCFLICYPVINVLYHSDAVYFSDRRSLYMLLVSIALSALVTAVFRKRLTTVHKLCHVCVFAAMHLVMLLLCYIIFTVSFRSGNHEIMLYLPDFVPICKYFSVAVLLNIGFMLTQKRRKQQDEKELVH